MAKFEETLNQYMKLPTGTLITDPTAIAELLDLAADYHGDLGQVACLRSVLQENTRLRRTEIDRICGEMKTRIILGDVPATYEDFLALAVQQAKICVTLDGRMSMGGQDASDGEAFATIHLLASNLGVFSKESALRAAWMLWRRKITAENLKVFAESISYEASAPDLWPDVIGHLVDSRDENYQKACGLVFQNAVWRVKRKIAGLPTNQHIMPYLRGRQGCGKSTFMKWFLGPVRTASVNADFDLFSHDEKMYMLHSSPIIFFDEIARADRADVAKVKNAMTSDTMMFRRLYGQATTQRVLATFFGAGNLFIQETINDSTGLRRFFQIEVKPDFFRTFGGIFSALNPLDLWRCVDEHGPCPIDDDVGLALIMAYQGDTRVKTSVELWLEDYAVTASPDWHDVADLFQRFATWRIVHFPTDHSTPQQFANQINRLLIDRREIFPSEQRHHSKTRRKQVRFTAQIQAIAA